MWSSDVQEITIMNLATYNIVMMLICKLVTMMWRNFIVPVKVGTVVAQWLRCRATNWKVAGSIPAGVSGFFIDIKSFRSHYGPGIESASNRNEYEEYFLGVKAAGV